jgi:superfamily II DNA or RNA helicase
LSAPIDYVRTLKRLIDTRSFQAGLAYALDNHVLEIRKTSENYLQSRVKGSGRNSYVTEISLQALMAPSPALRGSCSCPVGFNCKHVAATLIAYFQSDEAHKATPSSTDLELETAALPYETQIWLNGVITAGTPESYPPSVSQRVVYILRPVLLPKGPAGLCVDVMVSRQNKSGALSKRLERANFDRAERGVRPGYILQEDIDLYLSLNRKVQSYWHSNTSTGLTLPSFGALERLIATGRLYWEDLETGPLHMGEPLSGKIDWELSDKDYKLHPRLRVEGARAFGGEFMAYVDTEQCKIGEIEFSIGLKQAQALLEAPALKPEHAAHVAIALQTAVPQGHDLLPRPPLPSIETEEAPARILRLMTANAGSHGQGFNVPLIEIALRYANVRRTWSALANDERTHVEAVKDGRIVRALRHFDYEASLITALVQCDAIKATSIYPALAKTYAHHLTFEDDLEWLAFLEEILPALQSQGVEVEIDKNFPFQIGKVTRDLNFAFHEGSGFDWLELDVGIEVDGEKVDLAPMLAELISSPALDLDDLRSMADLDHSYFFKNRAGRYFSVAITRLLPLIISLHELRLGGFSVTRSGAFRLHKASKAFLDFDGDTALGTTDAGTVKSAYRQLCAPETLAPLTLPDGFKADLRPYQQTGVAWLNALRETGLGGILADDMGLGKTVQVLAFLAREKDCGRLSRAALIVTPTSLLANWQAEAAKFTPDLKLMVLHGKDRRDLQEEASTADIVLTTYPLVTRDQAWLESIQWYVLILDEAQAIKNPAATTTRLINKLKADHRFCLSGTPMENHLGELWSLMNFANPGFLGDRSDFARVFRTPIEKNANASVQKLLVRRVKPFLLRRTKADVAKELPPKSEIIERITLQGKQRDLYDTIRLSLHKKVRQAISERGLAKSHIIVLDALLKLRQVCCDPSLLDVPGAENAPSAKLDRLMEMVSALTEEGRRIIVFSQFTSMLDLIAARLENADFKFGMLTGKTKNRKKEVDAFQSGDCPIFLISLKAGGTGLNLTHADTVILYDPWWNPAVEAQAIDRAYRIGQDKPVFVYRLCAEGTIEDKMDEMKARKQGIADALFNEDAQAVDMLSDADIENLFG